MALTVTMNPGAGQMQGGLQGSSGGSLQLAGQNLQGNAMTMQGSSPSLQTTVAPSNGQSFSQPVAHTVTPATTTTTTNNNAAIAAANAAAAAHAQALANLRTNELNSMYATVGAFGTTPGMNDAADLQASAQGNLANIRADQAHINSNVQNAELNRQLGIRNLANTLRAGLNSGAVSLGNANALDSSAAQEMARAYGMYGDNQQNNINANANMALTQAQAAQANHGAMVAGDLAALKDKQATTLTGLQDELALFLKGANATGEQQGLQSVNYNQMINNALNPVNAALQGAVNTYQTGLASPNMDIVTPQQAAATAYQDYTKNALPINLQGYNFNAAPASGTPSATPASTVQLPLYTNKYLAG